MSHKNNEQPPMAEASYELETSVPTDLTVSSFSDEDKYTGPNKDLNLHFKDRRQFIHNVQLLKIELSQKNATIQNLQSVIASNIESFDEKLRDSVHRKQLLEARLRTELKIFEEEARHQIILLKNQTSKLEERESVLNLKNIEHEANIKTLNEVIENYNFSESEYIKLKTHQRETLGIVDKVLLRIHDHVFNLKKENEELSIRLSSCEQQEKSQQRQISKFREAVEQEREVHSELKEKYNKLLASCKQTQINIERGNYAQENFGRVKNERDKLEQEILDLRDENSRLKSSLILITQEKETEKQECALQKSRLALLQQECEHLGKQIGDITQRWGEARDKAGKIQLELDHAKSSKVELLERFMQTKDKLMHDYERSLKNETDKVIESQKSFYEKQLRLLNETKNTLDRQKQAAEMVANEYKSKYENLHTEICQKGNSDSHQISNLEKELESKRSENHNFNLLITQLHEALSEKTKEKKEISSKIKVLEQELELIKKETHEKILELEKEVNDKRIKLEIYDKLDHDLDQAIKSAAKVTEEDAGQMLETVSAQLSIPGTSRFSISRCVNLTRKVIELERSIHLMEKELEHLNKMNNELNQRLAKANELLDQVDQPYSYLISTVRAKEDHIQHLNKKIVDFLKQIESVKKEKEEMCRMNSELRVDLNQILSDGQELKKVKDLLDVLQKSKHNLAIGITDKSETKVKSVEKNVPEWYKKLKPDKR